VRPALGAAWAAAALAVLAPAQARAHHGVAAVGAAGPEGPGAAVETTSPLPLPEGMVFTMARSEYVPFRRRPAVADGKSYAAFNTVGIGYGIRPWLSAYAFQPFNVKAQEGLGRNAGIGDTSLMLSLGLKWDEGLRLVPEKESLDDLLDWHLGVSVASTLPDGPTAARGEGGAYFAPDMQTGFGAPSATTGASAMKQVGRALTWLGEASYQHFFPHTYRFTRYQFGDEVRLNTAAVWRALGRGRLRLDVCAEANGLLLQRDRQLDAAGDLAPLRASGGAILYGTAGLRLYASPFSVGLSVKRAALVRLNDQAAQQGAEGLELFRVALTVGYAPRF
jgi:hypothetical protein